MEIRLVKAEDIPRLLPLIEAYWKFEELSGFEAMTIGDALKRLIASPELGRAWIATSDKSPDPVGYLLLVYVFSLEHGGLTAEIDELFVAPKARGAGTGRRLLEVAEAACQDRGCRHLSLQVGTENEGAKKFYRSMGFSSRPGFHLLEKHLP